MNAPEERHDNLAGPVLALYFDISNLPQRCKTRHDSSRFVVVVNLIREPQSPSWCQSKVFTGYGCLALQEPPLLDQGRWRAEEPCDQRFRSIQVVRFSSSELVIQRFTKCGAAGTACCFFVGEKDLTQLEEEFPNESFAMQIVGPLLYITRSSHCDRGVGIHTAVFDRKDFVESNIHRRVAGRRVRYNRDSILKQKNNTCGIGRFVQPASVSLWQEQAAEESVEIGVHWKIDRQVIGTMDEIRMVVLSDLFHGQRSRIVCSIQVA